MDNSKVRCLKCNTRGVPAHGAVSEGGSRRYSPVLLRLIGCRCGILCSFYRAEIGCIWGTLWGEPCVRLQELREDKKKKKKKKTSVPYKYLNRAISPPPLANLSWVEFREKTSAEMWNCAVKKRERNCAIKPLIACRKVYVSLCFFYFFLLSHFSWTSLSGSGVRSQGAVICIHH